MPLADRPERRLEVRIALVRDLRRQVPSPMPEPDLPRRWDADLDGPAINGWTETGSMSQGRGGAPAVVLPDGSVLVVGGSFVPIFSQERITAERYDPVHATWARADAGLSTPGTLILLADGTAMNIGGGTRQVFTPLASAQVSTRCRLSLSGTDSGRHMFIRVAARDIASGLDSVQVLQATNATVVLSQFPPGYRDPALVTATKIVAGQPSTLRLNVTNRSGTTVTCDPVMAHLVDQHDWDAHQIFHNLSQAGSKLQLTNGTPGLSRVRVQVNGRHFRLDDLRDGEVRTLDVGSAMRSGEDNTIAVTTHGPRDSSALLVISD